MHVISGRCLLVLFTHLNKYSLSLYSVPGTVLDLGMPQWKKTDKNPCVYRAHSLVKKRHWVKIKKLNILRINGGKCWERNKAGDVSYDRLSPVFFLPLPSFFPSTSHLPLAPSCLFALLPWLDTLALNCLLPSNLNDWFLLIKDTVAFVESGCEL